MVEVLGNGRMADGQKYLMISESEWEEFEAFRVLFDFAREQDPDGFRENLREVAKELADDFPEEYKYLVKRNPWAVRYLKWFNGHRGRPEALNASQRDFIVRNHGMTGKALYNHLRADMGYKGALKTVQNELSKIRKLSQETKL